jgi:hypothetical protein
VKSVPVSEISEAVGDAWTAGARTVHDLRQSTADRASDLASAAAKGAPSISRAADRLVPSRRARAARRVRIREIGFAVGAVMLVATIVVLKLRRARSVTGDQSSTDVRHDQFERRTAVAGS